MRIYVTKEASAVVVPALLSEQDTPAASSAEQKGR